MSMADESIQMRSSSGNSSAERRKSANFTASTLLANLEKSNDQSITRLRRPHSNDGEEESVVRAGSRRSLVGRAMSGQVPIHRGVRRTKIGDNHDHDTHPLHMSMEELNRDREGMDASVMSNSNGGSGVTGSRRRLPPRARSLQDSCLARAAAAAEAGLQRKPRASRRPGRNLEDGSSSKNATTNDAGEETDISSRRRRPPPRTKSTQDVMPPRGVHQRVARPGRQRRPGREADDNDIYNDDQDQDEERTVLISDSDEDEQPASRMDRSTTMDRSMDRSGMATSSRRRLPARTRSMQDSCLPRGHAGNQQRTPRMARRRGSKADSGSDDGSTANRKAMAASYSGEVGVRRSSMMAGPGLARSNTATTNPRSSRNRSSRNTAAELARVTGRPDVSPDFEREPSPNNNGHSASPIRSRQARRRLREGKERGMLERTLSGSEEREAKLKIPEKKEEVWMKRLKKKVVESSNDEDVRSLDRSKNDKNGSNDQSDDAFFHLDPSFGVFPDAKTRTAIRKADALPPMFQTEEEESPKSSEALKQEQKGSMIEMKADTGKFDFGSIID